MQTVLEGLLELSRVAGDARQQRHVRLREAAQEAVRRLREKARAADVTVRLAPELPDCEVHAAAVELCLTNLISNAIKYADPTRYPRWVEISGRLAVGGEEGEREVIIEVRDNGRGVPAAERGRLFQRFFRGQGHTEAAIDGTGLGLSIVRETVEDLGGRVWADFPADGSVFGFSLPCRRGVERRAADRARAAAQVS
jgi:signal transduction histidine kinase